MKKGVNTALRLSIHRAHCQMAIGRYQQPSDYHGSTMVTFLYHMVQLKDLRVLRGTG